jgi:hypothetical protein
MLNEFSDLRDVGRENRDLGRGRGNARDTVNLKLAERVGVLERDFAKANEVNGCAITSPNRSDLASSNLCQRFRPFAGVCRVFNSNDTRNDTRCGDWINDPLITPCKDSDADSNRYTLGALGVTSGTSVGPYEIVATIGARGPRAADETAQFDRTSRRT